MFPSLLSHLWQCPFVVVSYADASGEVLALLDALSWHELVYRRQRQTALVVALVVLLLVRMADHVHESACDGQECRHKGACGGRQLVA